MGSFWITACKHEQNYEQRVLVFCFGDACLNSLACFNSQELFKFLWLICRILGHSYLEMMIFTLTDIYLLCRIVQNNQFYPISLWSSLYQAITPESRHWNVSDITFKNGIVLFFACLQVLDDDQAEECSNSLPLFTGSPIVCLHTWPEAWEGLGAFCEGADWRVDILGQWAFALSTSQVLSQEGRAVLR